MRLNLSPEDAAFRAEVRAFLDDRLTPDLRADAARQTGVFAEAPLNRRWGQILHERGWAAPGWPKAYGGAGFTPTQRYLFEAEMAKAGAPVMPAMGLQMCGPVLMEYGTAEQKAFFLPRILSGEHYWCQGYSEPQSGSDLASLQVRATPAGDDYLVSGSKIWTTHAHFANWIFLLVRTSSEGRPQAGITFLLASLDTPGVSIRPIVSISGQHEINEVFFDDARVPLANRVGDENRGWTVAKHLLQFERGSFYSARIKQALSELEAIARLQDGSKPPLLDQAWFRRGLADLAVAVSSVEAVELRVVSQMSLGQSVSDATASMLKLQGTETWQRITELGLEALGCYVAADQSPSLRDPLHASVGPAWALTGAARYLNMRAASIYGGTSEVQRNILARSVLGI